MSKSDSASLAIVPESISTRSAIALPAEGTPERARHEQAAADILSIVVAVEANPRTIVSLDGETLLATDVLRALRKRAQVAVNKWAERTPSK